MVQIIFVIACRSLHDAWWLWQATSPLFGIFRCWFLEIASLLLDLWSGRSSHLFIMLQLVIACIHIGLRRWTNWYGAHLDILVAMDLLLEGFPEFQLFLHQYFNLFLLLLHRVLVHEELEVVLALTPRLRSHHYRASVASLWSTWLWWILLLIY